MPEKNESPIISRRIVPDPYLVSRKPVRKQEPNTIIPGRKETISTADKLPLELQEILNNLSPDVPQEWKQQAVEAAYFIYSLDLGRKITDASGQSLDEKRQRFANQLANSGFSWGVYNRSSRWALDPTRSLPSWLHSREDPQKAEQLTKGEQKEVDTFYKQYVAKHATLHTSNDGQQYFYFTDGVPSTERKTITGVHRSKGYVEGIQLRKVQALERALNTLREQKLHPHATKLFGKDRLVLYWDSKLTDDQKSQIESVFGQQDIKMRAFGQDVPEIILTKDGYKVDSRASNDASLGDGGHNPFSWKDPEYNPGEFFRQYLQMTYWGCKNPAEPYKVSFIPIISGGINLAENVDRVGKLRHLIEETDHLPTVVTARSYLNCFEKRVNGKI